MPQQGKIPGAAPARCCFPKKNAPLQGIEIKFHSAQMTRNSSHLNNSSRRWQALPSIHWRSFLWWLKSQWPRSPQAPKHSHPPSHHMRIRKNQCKGQRSGWAALGFLEEETNKRIAASEHKLLRLWCQEPIGVHDSLMVQGSYTQLASEVKMKGQRRFPPGKACSLPPNKWYSRHLENGEKIYKFWRLKFVRFVDFFLGCGGREGLQIYALVNFTCDNAPTAPG